MMEKISFRKSNFAKKHNNYSSSSIFKTTNKIILFFIFLYIYLYIYIYINIYIKIYI